MNEVAQFPKRPNGLARPPCPKCNSINVRDENNQLFCTDCKYVWEFMLQGIVWERTSLILVIIASIATLVLLVWNLLSGWPMALAISLGICVVLGLVMGKVYAQVRIQRVSAEKNAPEVVALVTALQVDSISKHLGAIRAALSAPEKYEIFFQAFFEKLVRARQKELFAELRVAGDDFINERFSTYVAFKGNNDNVYRSEHDAFWAALSEKNHSKVG